MPSLGADMEAGVLTKWLVKRGDAVRRGDIVAIVQTEKADVDVEIFATGQIEKIVVSEGEKVPVGAVLATVRVEGEAPASAPAARAPAAPGAPVPPAPVPPPAVVSAAAPGERPRVSPAARRRAEELGVEISRLQGTGPGGAVTLEDVAKAAAVPGPVPAAGPADRAAAMRRAIAAAMSRSNREIPHYYLGTEVDMGAAVEWLAAENAKRGVAERVLPAVLLLKAVALAVREVPEMNGFFMDGAFRPGPAVHLGVAISLRGGGLVAPAIHDADRQSLPELMRGLSDIVARARAGSLKSSEMSDPTLTVTNLGDLGVESVFGVIFPPQVALVGFGRIVERPRVRSGTVVVRPTVHASLAADHRASDGHRGGRFLAAIDALLQKPEAL